MYKIQYYGFPFRMSTQVKAEVHSTKAVTLVRMRKKKPVISITGSFFFSIIIYLTCTIIVLLKKTNGMTFNLFIC